MMFKKYIPNECFKTIFDIEYESLYAAGIKFLMFDIDNTILSYENKSPNEIHHQFFWYLKNKGFEVCLVSNNHKKRVLKVANELGIYAVWDAFKPHKKGYLKAVNKMGGTINTSAFIGDQMLTDIKGANKCGIKSILVKTIDSKSQKWYTKINRIREKFILNKLKIFDYEKYQSLMKAVYEDEN